MIEPSARMRECWCNRDYMFANWCIFSAYKYAKLLRLRSRPHTTRVLVLILCFFFASFRKRAFLLSIKHRKFENETHNFYLIDCHNNWAREIRPSSAHPNVCVRTQQFVCIACVSLLVTDFTRLSLIYSARQNSSLYIFHWVLLDSFALFGYSTWTHSDISRWFVRF